MRKRTILTAFVASVLMTGSALAQSGSNFVFRYKGTGAITFASSDPLPGLQMGAMSIEYFDGGGNGNEIAEPLNFDVEGVTIRVPITARGSQSFGYHVDVSGTVGTDTFDGFCSGSLDVSETSECTFSLTFADFPTVAQHMRERPGESIQISASWHFSGLLIEGISADIGTSDKSRSATYSVDVGEAAPSDLTASQPMLGMNLDHDGGAFSTAEAASSIVIENASYLAEVAKEIRAVIEIEELGRAPLVCDRHTIVDWRERATCSAELELTAAEYDAMYQRHANGNSGYTSVNLGYEIVLIEMNGRPYSHTISSHPTGFFLMIGPPAGV